MWSELQWVRWCSDCGHHSCKFTSHTRPSGPWQWRDCTGSGLGRCRYIFSREDYEAIDRAIGYDGTGHRVYPENWFDPDGQCSAQEAE